MGIEGLIKPIGDITGIIDKIVGPSAEKFGKALGAMTGILLRPLQYYMFEDDVSQLQYSKNLKKLAEELEKIDEQELGQPIPEIVAPILDRLSYVKNEQIRDAFIKLLVSASTIKGASAAHPAFIYLIDRLSVDEAKMLTYIRNFRSIKILTINLPKQRKSDPERADGMFTNFDPEHWLQTPTNFLLYLDNLTSLGIVKHLKASWLENAEERKEIEILFSSLIESYKNQFPEELRKRVQWTCQFFTASAFGDLFIKTCLPESEDTIEPTFTL